MSSSPSQPTNRVRTISEDWSDYHPAAIYGMAKAALGDKLKPGFKISSFKIKSVTNKKCEMSVVTCCGDLCEMHTAAYSFNPPLPLSTSPEGVQESKNRIHTIRNMVCAPSMTWLITNPLAFLILVVCSALAYGTLILGVSGMVDSIGSAPNLEAGVELLFGSTSTFANLVVGAFYFSIFAHGIEAVMAMNYTMNVLQLDIGPSITWSFLIFLVGYPIFSELQELVKVQQGHQSKTK